MVPEFFYDEAPKTRFVDLNDALSVQLLAGPSPEHIRASDAAVQAGFSFEPVEVIEGSSLAQIAAGKTLWQSLEDFDFHFLVSGCSRFLTHQLVRARIGVKFSQQNTGDMDHRHADVIVPRPIWSEAYIGSVLAQKKLYADLIDSRRVAPHEARYALPAGIATFIYMKANLAMLAPWYGKRSCTMTQSFEMVHLAEAVKAEVIAHYPDLGTAFVSPCISGNCWWSRTIPSGKFTTYYFKVDNLHHSAAHHVWSRAPRFSGTQAQVSSGALPSPLVGRKFEGLLPCSS